MKTFILALSAFLLFSVYQYSQVTHFVYFNSVDLSITQVSGDDENTYTKIIYEDLQWTDEIGNPELPVRYINLIIPTDQKVREITLRLSNEEVYNIEYPVYPAQQDIPTSIYFEGNDFVIPNSEIYELENPYPSAIVKVAHYGYFDGNNHIITLAIHPLQYFPALNQLIFYPDIGIILEMESANPPNMVIFNRKQSNQDIYDNILLNLVDNPEDVPSYQVRPVTFRQILETDNLEREIESYEYVIITSQALKNSFNRFIEWEKRKGIDIYNA